MVVKRHGAQRWLRRSNGYKKEEAGVDKGSAVSNGASAGGTIDVGDLIDGARLGRFQIMVAALCSIIVFFDGFDTQLIAFIAPPVSAEFHLTRAQLGPMFSASLGGILIGALFFGPLADRFGRRRVILISTALFAVLTLLSAGSASFVQLLVLRFLTGLGLGGAMPNAISLTAEYCPRRRRSTMVMIMFMGFSFGAAASGALAAWIIPHYGWRTVLLTGGVLPLLLCVALFIWLPESVRFLVLGKAAPRKIERLVNRVVPYAPPLSGQVYAVEEETGRGMPVAQLFRARPPMATILLWVVFFVNLMTNFTLQNWIPILATDSGIPVQQAALIGSVYQIGSVVAALTLGLVMDRLGAFRVVPVLLLLAVPLIAAFGFVTAMTSTLIVLAFGAGFCVPGGQTCMNALAAVFYPTAVRSTGVGWALGMGRIGAIIGPLAAGWLLANQVTVSSLFVIVAAIQTCAGIACFAMGQVARRGHSETPLTSMPAAALAKANYTGS